MEAISHLRTGLALLQTLPESPQRTQQDLLLHITLGASLIATQGAGAAEVQQAYSRARHLCQHLEEPQQLFPALRGLWHYYNVHAEYQMAHTLAQQLLTLAQQVQDPGMLLVASRVLGTTLYWLGAVASASRYFAQGIALYDAQQHRTSLFLYGEDSGVVCHSRAAWALWLLGYPDQAFAHNHEAVTLAQQSTHPYSLGYVLSCAAVFHQYRRDVYDTQAYATAAIDLATAQGFPYWIAYGSFLRGWALAHQGQPQEGIEQMHQGLRAHRATGAEISRPYFLTLFADVHGTIGEPEAGLTVLTEALALMGTTGERWYEAEIYRLQGELLLQQNSDHQAEAETCYQQAIAIAQNQQAKSFELRTATSLARLWQLQGKRQEAHDLLAPVYGWFTEGFDTADLQEAKALLEALA
jgi:predicted ATPase